VPGRIARAGTIIAIGGGEDKTGSCVILREVARRVKGKLIIATVASQSPDEYFETYAKAFKELGVKNLCELYVRDRAEALDPNIANGIHGAGGIFFTGGDQLRIASQIGDTNIERAVQRIHAAGGVIAGTSAGASVMSSTMLVKGSSAESHRIGDLHMAPGLGLLRDVIIDQHFAERGRIGRLLGAVAQNPRVLGVGIDENTAIIVNGSQFRVQGTGAVYIVDAAGVTYSNVAEAKPDRVLSLCDVRLHVLSAGEGFHLAKRRPSCRADGAQS
jgi:cyanophycinase